MHTQGSMLVIAGSKECVNELDLPESSINTLDNRIVVIFRKSCAKELHDNSISVWINYYSA